MSTEAGVAYIRLLPSLDGFSAAVTKGLKGELRAPMSKAGSAAGRDLSKGIQGGVAGSEGKLKSSAGRVGDIFKAGLFGAGLTGAALLTTGISQAIDTTAVEDKLVAQLGGGEWAEEAADVAGTLYGRAFGDSMGDTAGAVKQVLQAGILEEDQLDSASIEKLTARALTFSDVLDQDLGMSLQSVDRMLATGLAGSAEEAFDILTAGIQGGVDRSGDLTETFQEYSTMFRDIGLSGSDAMGLLSLGLKGGARDADVVADSLKEFAIRAQDGSKLSAEGFAAIGLSAEEMTAAVAKGGPGARAALDQVLKGLQGMEDPTARNAAAVALFGTKAEDLGDALFNLDLDRAGLLMHDAAGSADGLASAYDNAKTRITAFKRQGLQKLTEFVGGTVIPKAEALAGVVGPVLSSAFSGLQRILDRVDLDRVAGMWSVFTDSISGGIGFDFAGQMGSVQDLGTSIGSVIDAVRPAVDYFLDNEDLLMGALAGVAGVVSSLLIPALVGLVAPLVAAAAPFVAAGLAAAAIGAGLVWAYENVEVFRSTVDTVLPQIGELFSSVFDLIVTVITTAIAIGKAIWSAFGDDILTGASIVWDLISGVVEGGLDIVIGIVRTATALLKGDWSGAWDGIKQILSGALTIVKSVLRAAFDSIKLIVRVGWTILKATFRTAVDVVKGYVKSRIDDIVAFFRAFKGRIRSAVSGLAGAIKSPFESAFNGIKRLWNRTVGGFGFSIPDWVGIGKNSFEIPRMHGGGVVDGPPGSEQLRVLEGGETVFSRDQTAALGSIGEAQKPRLTVVRVEAGGDALYKAWLRHTVRVEAGGDVQEWFEQAA